MHFRMARKRAAAATALPSMMMMNNGTGYLPGTTKIKSSKSHTHTHTQIFQFNAFKCDKLSFHFNGVQSCGCAALLWFCRARYVSLSSNSSIHFTCGIHFMHTASQPSQSWQANESVLCQCAWNIMRCNAGYMQFASKALRGKYIFWSERKILFVFALHSCKYDCHRQANLFDSFRFFALNAIIPCKCVWLHFQNKTKSTTTATYTNRLQERKKKNWSKVKKREWKRKILYVSKWLNVKLNLQIRSLHLHCVARYLHIYHIYFILCTELFPVHEKIYSGNVFTCN